MLCSAVQAWSGVERAAGVGIALRALMYGMFVADSGSSGGDSEDGGELRMAASRIDGGLSATAAAAMQQPLVRPLLFALLLLLRQ